MQQQMFPYWLTPIYYPLCIIYLCSHEMFRLRCDLIQFYDMLMMAEINCVGMDWLRWIIIARFSGVQLITC